MSNKSFNHWLLCILPGLFSNARPALYSATLYVSIFLGIISCSEVAQAKELYVTPSIHIETEYDDNKRLKSDRFDDIDKSTFGVITSAGAKIGARSNRYDIALDNQVIINRYSGDFDLDSEDFIVDLASSFNLTDTNILSLGANYTRDTTLTSEIDTTGLVQDNITRQQWSISPDWTYLLSNTQFLQANYSHNEVNYEESATSNFADYTTDIVTLSFSQQWTPRLRGYVAASALFYEVPEIGSGISKSKRETTEYSINVGFEYQISPTWSTAFSAGNRFTNTEITFQQFNFNTLTFEEVTTSDDEQGLIFSGSLDKRFEAGSAGISFSRSTVGQGNGQFQVLEKVSANFRHRIIQNLQVSLTGQVIDTSTSGSDNDRNERTYYDIKPSLRWLFDKNASVTVGYKYRMQEFENTNETAESNSVFLKFNYQWDKFSTQRY